MYVYFYCTDIYCDECGKAIRRELVKNDYAPANSGNEGSYDSSEFPKGPYPDGGGESDSPQHCGSGPLCINALELSNGYKAGVWLENPLTTDGVKYVKEAIHGGGEVAKLWAEYYVDYLTDSAAR